MHTFHACYLRRYLICSHFIKSIKDSIEKFVWGGAFILSVLLFMSTGNIVESRMNKNAKILSITPDRKDVLEKADYIHVVKMSSADLDKYQYGNYLDFSTSSKKSGARDITFHYYEVYALRSVPNVFIGHEVTETHDYSFAKKKALETERHFLSYFYVAMHIADRGHIACVCL